MTSDLCTDDVVVCIASPQVISTEGGVVGGSASRVAASSAAVELGRRLLLAARAGHTAQVLDLMAKGAPFTTDWLGTSPLHLAATNNHVETCAVLLRAGVSRDARTKVERTPLHMAAYAGHAGVVRLLLEHDAAVDCRDMLRMTPLHWASQRGHSEVVSLLLSAGSALAPLSKFGKTPRALAAAAGRRDVIDLLDLAAQRLHEPSPEAPPAPSWRAPDNDTDAGVEDINTTTTTTQGFQPIHRLQEIKMTNIKIKPQQEKTSTNESKTENQQTNINNSSDSSAAQLLRRHGITLLPADDGSTVLSALQCGRTVVLSDAGKLMLKESSPPQTAPAPQPPPPPPPEPAPAPTPAKGLKLFTLNNKVLLNNAKFGKNNLSNVQLSQVKFVQLKDKLIPQKTVPLKLSAKRARAPVKIILNKQNYKLLGPGLQPHIAQQQMNELPQLTTVEPEAPTQVIEDDGPALRAELQAARQAIAALSAELTSCRARLALLERRG